MNPELTYPETASLFPASVSTYKNFQKTPYSSFMRMSEKVDTITTDILKYHTVIGLQGEAILETKQNTRNVDYLATIGCTTCTCVIFETKTHAALLHLDGGDTQFNCLIPKVLETLTTEVKNGSEEKKSGITCHMIGGMSSKDAVKIFERLLTILKIWNVKLETYCIGIHSSTYVNSKDEDKPEEVNVIYEKVDEGGTMFFPDFVNLAFDLKTGTIHKFNMCEKEDLEVIDHQYQRSTGWACSQKDDEDSINEENIKNSSNKIFYNCGNFHVPSLKFDVDEETKRFLQVLSRNPKFCLDYFSTSPHSTF